MTDERMPPPGASAPDDGRGSVVESVGDPVVVSPVSGDPVAAPARASDESPSLTKAPVAVEPAGAEPRAASPAAPPAAAPSPSEPGVAESLTKAPPAPPSSGEPVVAESLAKAPPAPPSPSEPVVAESLTNAPSAAAPSPATPPPAAPSAAMPPAAPPAVRAAVEPVSPDVDVAAQASPLPGAHRGGFSRLPTAPVDVTVQTAPAVPGGEYVPAEWAPTDESPLQRGLAGWALGFSIVGLVVSMFVGWGFPIGLAAVVIAIIALRRPLESRAIAVWALALGGVSILYSAGWLVYVAQRASLLG